MFFVLAPASGSCVLLSLGAGRSHSTRTAMSAMSSQSSPPESFLGPPEEAFDASARTSSAEVDELAPRTTVGAASNLPRDLAHQGASDGGGGSNALGNPNPNHRPYRLERVSLLRHHRCLDVMISAHPSWRPIRVIARTRRQSQRGPQATGRIFSISFEFPEWVVW